MLPAISLSEEWQYWDSAFSVGFGGMAFLAREQRTNSFAAAVEEPLLGLLRINSEVDAQSAGAEAARAQLATAEADLRQAVEVQFLRYFEARALGQIADTSARELMDPRIDSTSSWLSELLAPTSVDEFLSKYWLRQHLFCRGATDRFSDLLSWPVLNRILEHHWRETYRFRLACQGRDLEPASRAGALTLVEGAENRDRHEHPGAGVTEARPGLDRRPIGLLPDSFPIPLIPRPRVSIMREAVVVASCRTPLAKSFRGSLNLTRPDDFAGEREADHEIAVGAQRQVQAGQDVDIVGAFAARDADDVRRSIGVGAREGGRRTVRILVGEDRLDA